MKRNNLIKLGDFGIARELTTTSEMAATVVGTPYYLSPEIVQSNKYDYKTDVWSLGVVLYELCALKPPFNGTTIHMLALQIVTGKYMPLPAGFSPEMNQLVKRLLTVDAAARPSCDEILETPVITKRLRVMMTNEAFVQEFSKTQTRMLEMVAKT